MLHYFVKRLGLGILTIFVVVACISFIIYWAPVDPTRISFGQRTDENTVQLLKKKYFLDKPPLIQILRYFEDLFPLQFISRMDERMKDYKFLPLWESNKNVVIVKLPFLRRSYHSGVLVSAMLIEAIWPTLLLATAATFLSFILGCFLGWLASIHAGNLLDRLIVSTTSLLYALPSYVTAIILSIGLAFYLNWFPIQGSLWDLNDNGELSFHLDHLWLPLIALAIRPIGQICQMVRVSILEVKNADFVRTAYAKGLTERQVFYQHILKNAINPVISTVGSWFASLLTGAYFVEFVFNYKGMGLLTIQAVNQFDIPVVSGCCVAAVIIFTSVGLISDFLYAVFDPRVKLEN
ncbi:MAG: ABC transporter permease [Saprospiraceae bacterium]|nr:ABC transporter permease [Saprospiraceae bacterium]